MESKKFSFVGPSCGHHASYTFYKAIKYHRDGRSRILSLGQFFFVKIWSDSDLTAVGEVQLFWEDKNTNQIMSSLRLYLLPEYTPEGRMQWHGEDEVVSVSEKAVLKVSDLLDWIANPNDVKWDRGLLGFCWDDCTDPKQLKNTNGTDNNNEVHFDKGLCRKFSPFYSEFLSDIQAEKESIGDIPALDELAVIILSISQYTRYRAMLKRLSGREKDWMHSNIAAALGGFTVQTRKTFIVFCRESFDYAELEEHPYLCNHLAPKLKGRPRKRKKLRRAGSPESESNSSESSVSTSTSVTTPKNGRNGLKKDFVSLLSQKNTKEESDFLTRLIKFMEMRNTPIERPPMLGYKQIDLHLFYQKVEKLGGYDGCMSKKAWKSIYDDLGGNPVNTSAATCTRKHYEKFLLPFEKHIRGQDGRKGARKKMMHQSDSNSNTDSEKDSKSPVMSANNANCDRKDSPASGGQDQPGSPDEEKAKKSPIDANETPVTNENQDGENEIEEQEQNGDVKDEQEVKGKDDEHLENGNVCKTSTASTEASTKLPLDSKLVIDDLIITPNQLSTPPEGGSALQNLAKIASRYQNPPQSSAAPSQAQPNRQEHTPSPGSKRQSTESGMAGQPVPPSKKQSLGGSTSAVPPNSLFSLLNPAALLQWSTAQAKGNSASSLTSGMGKGSSLASSSATLAAAAAAAGLANLPLPDPAKLGPESYSATVLQYYEKQLKALAAQQQQQQPQLPPMTPPNNNNASSPSPFASKSGGRDSVNSNASGRSGTPSKKERNDRSKVSKPPPDNKRPPSLMQTPCAFVQTTNIYTNPMAELKKLKEQNSLGHLPGTSANSGEALDLSSDKRVTTPATDAAFVSNALNLKRESQGGQLDLSLKKESSLLANPSMRMKYDESPKSSPFSTESLLSNKATNLKPSNQDLVKIAPLASISDLNRKGASPSSLRSRESPYPSSSPIGGDKMASSSARSSPWHTPVSLTSPSQKETASGGKPAIPVSPVVREDRRDSSATLSGLLPPSSTVTSGSTPISLPLPASSLSSLASVTNSFAHPSLPASNPYLALMSSSHSPLAAAAAAAAAASPNSKSPATSSAYPATPVMDPATSAYYAALYSQQMFAGLSPYGLSSGLRPGMPPSAATTGLDPLQAQMLQAMLARGGTTGSGNPPSSSNPFGGAAGGSPGFPGIPGLYPGLGGFPPHRKDN